MASEKKEPQLEDDREDDRVEIMVPRGSQRDDPNVFIAVNGVSYILPKGKKSKVPKAIAEEYERSVMAESARIDHAEKMLEEATPGK